MSRAFRTYHEDSSREEVLRTRKGYEKQRKNALKKLAGWILIHNTVDFRVVKRFRFWQVRILKERIIAFKRKLRMTNKNYLSSRMRVLLRIFKRSFSLSLSIWRQGQISFQLPTEIQPDFSSAKFAVLVHSFQAKNRLSSHFKSPIGNKVGKMTKNDADLWGFSSKKRAFSLWISRSYQPEPLLHRKYQVLMQMKVLIERRFIGIKENAWKDIKKFVSFPFVVPLISAVKTPIWKVVSSAWDRIKDLEGKKTKFGTVSGVRILANFVENRVKQRVVSLEMFEKWRGMIRKKENKEGIRAMKRLGKIAIRRPFFTLIMTKTGPVLDKKLDFDVDKHVISNQALLLVHLEKALSRRTRETTNMHKVYSLHVLANSLQRKIRAFWTKWTSIRLTAEQADLTHEKEVKITKEIFSYLQELEDNIGLNSVPEGEEEMSGSRFSDFESLRAKIGRISTDSAVQENE